MNTRSNILHRRGFTLVELLVVIAIIVVLASLAFVGGNKARKTAQRTVASGIAKNLMVANASYYADNNGKYVPMWANDKSGVARENWVNSRSFREALGTDIPDQGWDAFEIEETMVDPRIKSEAKGDRDKWSRLEHNWGMIAPYPPGGWGTPFRVAQHTSANVTDPTNMAAFASGADWILQYSKRDALKDKQNFVGKEGQAMRYSHDGRAIVVYFDGHAESQRYEDLNRQWQNGGQENVFWGGPVSAKAE